MEDSKYQVENKLRKRITDNLTYTDNPWNNYVSNDGCLEGGYARGHNCDTFFLFFSTHLIFLSLWISCKQSGFLVVFVNM